MKIENAKILEENNKNVKIIESFLTESGKNVGEYLLGKPLDSPSPNGLGVRKPIEGSKNILNNLIKIDQSNNEFDGTNNIQNNDNLKASALNVSNTTFTRLKEVYLISNLRRQNAQLKKVISEKEEDIENYKNNMRCAKYSKLEYNYSNNLNQLIQIKKENESYKSNIEEITSKYSEILDENQKLINSLTKYRSNFDEIKIKSKTLEENNLELTSRNKYLEDKVNLLTKSLNSQPVQLQKTNMRIKDNAIINLRNELLEEKEKHKSDRQRLEKRIYYMLQDFNKIKEALE